MVNMSATKATLHEKLIDEDFANKEWAIAVMTARKQRSHSDHKDDKNYKLRVKANLEEYFGDFLAGRDINKEQLSVTHVSHHVEKAVEWPEYKEKKTEAIPREVVPLGLKPFKQHSATSKGYEKPDKVHVHLFDENF